MGSVGCSSRAAPWVRVTGVRRTGCGPLGSAADVAVPAAADVAVPAAAAAVGPAPGSAETRRGVLPAGDPEELGGAGSTGSAAAPLGGKASAGSHGRGFHLSSMAGSDPDRSSTGPADGCSELLGPVAGRLVDVGGAASGAGAAGSVRTGSGSTVSSALGVVTSGADVSPSSDVATGPDVASRRSCGAGSSVPCDATVPSGAGSSPRTSFRSASTTSCCRPSVIGMAPCARRRAPRPPRVILRGAIRPAPDRSVAEPS